MERDSREHPCVQRVDLGLVFSRTHDIANIPDASQIQGIAVFQLSVMKIHWIKFSSYL